MQSNQPSPLILRWISTATNKTQKLRISINAWHISHETVVSVHVSWKSTTFYPPSVPSLPHTAIYLRDPSVSLPDVAFSLLEPATNPPEPPISPPDVTTSHQPYSSKCTTSHNLLSPSVRDVRLRTLHPGLVKSKMLGEWLCNWQRTTSSAKTCWVPAQLVHLTR